MKIKPLNQMILGLSMAAALAAVPLWAVDQQDEEVIGDDPDVLNVEPLDAEPVEPEPVEPEPLEPEPLEPEPLEAEQPEGESVQALRDWVRGREDLTVMAAILDAVHLGKTIEEDAIYTFFLPNDDAFAEKAEEEGLGAEDAEDAERAMAYADKDPEELKATLLEHFALGSYSASDLREAPVMNLAGHAIESSRDLLFRQVAVPVESKTPGAEAEAGAKAESPLEFEGREAETQTEAEDESRTEAEAETKPIGDRARLVDRDIEVGGNMIHVINKVWSEHADEEEAIEAVPAEDPLAIPPTT